MSVNTNFGVRLPEFKSSNAYYLFVIKHKFVCLMHTEAKQTEKLEFGAEKCLFQGQARRTGGSSSKVPYSLMVFREKFLEANFEVRAIRCMTYV